MASMPRKTVPKKSAKPPRRDRMLLSKRGVYLISQEGKLRSFRLITWAQIRKRLES
jgi:hypothetical protein